MKTRKLGNDLEVSALGLGCMGMTAVYGPAADKQEMIKLIHAAHDRGITLFDTPRPTVPSPTRNWSARRCSRSAARWSSPPSSASTSTRRPASAASAPTAGPSTSRAVEKMLQRLRTDHIDLLYQHRVDPAVPIEDVAGAVKDLIAAGKVKHFGLSEAGVQTIRRAHAVQPLTAVQSEYSLFWRGPELELLPLLEELGIGFVPFSPLGAGFLTGKITDKTTFDPTDFRNHVPRFSVEARKANMALVKVVESVAGRNGATPAQVALAWLLAQKPWVVPIPGTTKLNRLEENIGAVTLDLKPQDIAQLNAEVAKIKVEGERLPEAALKMTGL